jgi:EAL domain-containing protein (putative c-di-GMP-specific phosphodiesterase class I)
VDARGNRIVGAEALVRWHHPQLGAQSPSEFIKVLEDSGLILEVGTWILDEACAAFQQLIAEGLIDPLNFSLCVNISPGSSARTTLSNGSNTSSITALQLLKLEITEGIVIQNLEDTISKMRRLKKLGVSFAMDDFGTGYSSLTYLKRLPVDALKIDQSFVRDATRPQRRRNHPRHRRHGPQPEPGGDRRRRGNPEQLAFLQKLGCHLYQGFAQSTVTHRRIQAVAGVALTPASTRAAQYSSSAMTPARAFGRRSRVRRRSPRPNDCPPGSPRPP